MNQFHPCADTFISQILRNFCQGFEELILQWSLYELN